MASLLENLHNFLLTCPFLTANTDEPEPQIHIDYLSDTPTTYEIQMIPGAPWVRRYVDGGGIKQADFIFRSCEDYGPVDTRQNIKNSEFYEQFENWLARTKPNIANWVKVEALTGGYVFETPESQDRAIYQMQCRIVYTQI